MVRAFMDFPYLGNTATWAKCGQKKTEYKEEEQKKKKARLEEAKNVGILLSSHQSDLSMSPKNRRGIKNLKWKKRLQRRTFDPFELSEHQMKNTQLMIQTIFPTSLKSFSPTSQKGKWYKDQTYISNLPSVLKRIKVESSRPFSTSKWISMPTAGDLITNTFKSPVFFSQASIQTPRACLCRCFGTVTNLSSGQLNCRHVGFSPAPPARSGATTAPDPHRSYTKARFGTSIAPQMLPITRNSGDKRQQHFTNSPNIHTGYRCTRIYGLGTPGHDNWSYACGAVAKPRNIAPRDPSRATPNENSIHLAKLCKTWCCNITTVSRVSTSSVGIASGDVPQADSAVIAAHRH
ncbi:hypothetical protein VP01_947g2 [Puccinia sorghi]|uniref:Uncharacterized protein n=1 Tax=Puccinia sorghi TaxID=27349 RepID=A0A0L6U8K7_9BASI|nr:hypothetical protein VP01_947g2 [Puccinia sorghi]